MKNISSFSSKVSTKSLILSNDSSNTFDYVIDCLVSLCDHDPLQAEQCVLLTHHIGYCEILTGDQQDLELIEKDLALYGLTVNIV